MQQAPSTEKHATKANAVKHATKASAGKHATTASAGKRVTDVKRSSRAGKRELTKPRFVLISFLIGLQR